MAIYEAQDKASGQSRLIDAPNNHAAMMQAARNQFDVTVASPRRVGELVKAGVEIEDYVPSRRRADEPELPEAQETDDALVIVE